MTRQMIREMKNKPCRDCGYLLETTARGCPRCAMNIEAERMIDRFIWWRVAPFVIAVVVLGAVFLILLR